MSISVLVVDDSAFMRKVLSDMITSTPGFSVVGAAKNGAEAIEMTKALKPNVITMDVEMPIMDGLSALEVIMRTIPTPVIMFSTLTHSGGEATLRALELGAVDFVAKPTSFLKVNTVEVRTELFEKLQMASKVRMNLPKMPARSVPTPTPTPIVPRSAAASAGRSGEQMTLVLLGTSTGGPKALQSVLPKLPKDLNAAILLVQHMPAGFTKSLAERMDALSQMCVKEATNGEPVVAGHCYIAPGGYHLRIEHKGSGFAIKLDADALVTGHRPSFDALLFSAVACRLSKVVGVIMTGMGADGVKGLVEIKRKFSAQIIAQNEDTCVVYGMPKSAVEAGVVDRLVPLNDIAQEIIKAVEV